MVNNMFKPGNWLRVKEEEREIYGDNLIYIVSNNGDEYSVEYYYDWEAERLLLKSPRKDELPTNEGMVDFYQEYTPRELVISMFEDSIYFKN